MLDKSLTTREFPGATQQRELAAGRQMAKRANEQAIANAHRPPDGPPQFTASQETQPQPQRPKINLPSGGG